MSEYCKQCGYIIHSKGLSSHREICRCTRIIDPTNIKSRLEQPQEKPQGPLIGYMIFDECAEDYSFWDGVISYPNPEGSNLAWEKPIAMIEKSAYDEVCRERDVLKLANKIHLENETKLRAENDSCKETITELKAKIDKIDGAWKEISKRKQDEITSLKQQLLEANQKWEMFDSDKLIEENASLKATLEESHALNKTLEQENIKLNSTLRKMYDKAKKDYR